MANWAASASTIIFSISRKSSSSENRGNKEGIATPAPIFLGDALSKVELRRDVFRRLV